MAPPFAQKTSKTAQMKAAASRARTSKADIARDLDIARGRKEFFSNRPDVSDDRALRRIRQFDERQSFENLETKPVLDSSGNIVKGLTQARTPGGKTLAQKEMELANKYGPTFTEIASDMGYAIGSMAKGVAEKGIGLVAILKGVSDKFSNDANKNYNNLNDVAKEIADNPNKYPLTSGGLTSIDAVNSSRNLALEAIKDANSFAADASGVLGIDTNRLDSFVNEPMDTLSGATVGPKVDLRSAKDYIDERKSFNLPVFREPVVPAQEIKQSALDRFDPEYLEQQKKLLDELNISPQVEELKQDNIQIKDGEATPITDEEFKEKEEKVNKIFEGDDFFSQVTEFNNPGNLTDVGQAGTTGQTYGNNFAVFPTAQAGITALENDLALKVNRSNKVEDIIGQYAAGDPNVGNYIDFVKNRVGPTVDQNELDDLRNAVIRFENKPDIAERYLALVADGGLMDKKMYGGIIASKG
jgi:hypothetical protein